MLSILCPHCQTKLAVEEQWRGKIINCLSCGQKLGVAAAQPPAAVAQTDAAVVVKQRPTTTRRRKPAIGNRIVSVAMHLSITIATVFFGYYYLFQRNAAPPDESVEAIPEKVSVAKPAEPVVVTPQVVDKATPINSLPTQPRQPLPTEAVETVSAPFAKLPQQITLPPSDSASMIIIGEDLTDVRIRLLSHWPNLTFQEGEIFWKAKEEQSAVTIARLKCEDGALQFQWNDSVPEQAETAVRNAVVHLDNGTLQHCLNFRKAEVRQPFQVDLSKAKQRIICKCEFPPAAERVFFEFRGLEQLPACLAEGGDLARLPIREQAILGYLDAEGAQTTLSAMKRGKNVMVQLESRYKLPSGSEHPLSIARGNSKLKELEALRAEVQSAEVAITELRERLRKLQKEISAVPRSRATALAKSAQLASLNQAAATTQEGIRYAEKLLAQKQAIEADYQAIQAVAKLAQELHGARLTYRFYGLVDGREVDLLIAR